MLHKFKKLLKKIVPSGIFGLCGHLYWSLRNIFFSIARKILQYSYDTNNICVDIGGGLSPKRGWKVLDYGSNAYPHGKSMLDYNFDLQSTNRVSGPLPIETNSVNFLFSSHCLEHITISAVRECFYEFYRILKKGGGLSPCCSRY